MLTEYFKNSRTFTGQFGPLNVNFRFVEFGPDPKSPRLLWATGKTPKNIIELQQKLLYYFPKQKEKRKFKMHLTLARFKYQEFRKFQIQNMHLPIEWQESFREVTLFESVLSPGGAEYSVLGTIPL